MKTAYRIGCYAAMCVGASLLVGCGGADHKGADKADDTVRVRTMYVDDVVRDGTEVTYQGAFEAGTTTTAAFNTAGTIKELNLSVGQHVTKGQLIGVVDDASLRSTYQGALALQEEAQDAYNRLKILHEKKAVADIKWVEVQSKLKQAQAMAEVARTAMNDSRLYAPASGIVSKKLAEPGQTALPGIPVAEIISSGVPRAVVGVPENQIADITQGMEGWVKCSPLGHKLYRATVTEKAVEANSLTRSYAVKLTLSAAPDSIKPGMICSVTFRRQAPRQTADKMLLQVPPEAVVLMDDNRNTVWLNVKGRAQRRYVRLAGMTDTGVLIDSGLQAGDQIIIGGQQKVSQGTPVKPVK